MNLRTTLALLSIVLAAAAAFAAVTRDFQAVTADSARRVDLSRSPRTLPPLPLIDSHEHRVSLSDPALRGSQATLVALVYTRCATICRTASSGQAFLQHAIRAQGLEGRIKLLTLSFDPQHDTPAALAAYAERQQADLTTWTFATVANTADLPALLRLFDVVVLPDGLGGYSHNAALFQLDASGQLVRAYAIDRPDLALIATLEY